MELYRTIFAHNNLDFIIHQVLAYPHYYSWKQLLVMRSLIAKFYQNEMSFGRRYVSNHVSKEDLASFFGVSLYELKDFVRSIA